MTLSEFIYDHENSFFYVWNCNILKFTVQSFPSFPTQLLSIQALYMKAHCFCVQPTCGIFAPEITQVSQYFLLYTSNTVATRGSGIMGEPALNA
jgi:hypothetical protein